MEKSVIISIQGTQVDTEGEREVIEFVTKGSLEGNQEDGYALFYEESELTGMEGTVTTFQIGKEQITMLRSGSVNSEMIFQEGQRHVSLYDTGFGGLMIGVNTQKAQANLGKDGGSVELRYVIEVENTVVGENSFHIQVREPGATLPQS